MNDSAPVEARMNRAPQTLRVALALTLSVCSTGCDDLNAAATPATSAPASVTSAAASVANQAISAAPLVRVPASASRVGGEAPSTAITKSQAPSAVPIPRGKVPTSLTQNPPRPIKGEPRGPIDTQEDARWLRRMSYASVTKATQNKGGSTVTIRLYFEDGYRAVLKADQKRSATNFRSEIVAYHLDRLLGCARTAPVVGRKLPKAALRKLLESSNTDPKFLARFDDELAEPEPDTLRGAVIAWHTQRLYSLAVPRSWAKWLADGPREPASADSPNDAATAAPSNTTQVPTEIEKQLPALEELAAFDYLLDNTDRWSGGNTLLLGEGGPMIFLDNGAGFADWRMQKKLALDGDLERVCEFPDGLVRNLRALGPSVPPAQRLGQRLSRSLAKDPMAPVLSEEHLSAIDWRLNRLLAHIDSCRK